MKTIATIAALFIAITTYAQEGLKEGYKILGGSFSFNVSESEDDAIGYYTDYNQNRFNSFNFSPYYGRFYADNQLIGLKFGVNTGSSEYSSEELIDNSDQIDRTSLQENNSTQLSLGIFWRYYLPISEKIGFLVEPALNGFWEKRKNLMRYERYRELSYEQNEIDEYETISKGYGVRLYLNAGFYYFPLPQLSLEVLLGNFVTDFTFGKTSSKDLENLELQHERNYSRFNINFKAANSFRFDELIRLNYYF